MTQLADTTRVRATRTPRHVRRAQLIEEGAHLIAERGFDNVTVEQITDSVGLVKGGFYHHFSSKQELLTSIMVETYKDGLRILDHLFSEHDSSRTRTEAYVREHARWVLRHSDRVEIIRRELARLPEEEAADITAFRRRFADGLASLIESGQADGDFDSSLDPRLAAHVIFGMLNWLAQWHREGTPASDHAIAENVVNQALGGLDTHTPPGRG